MPPPKYLPTNYGGAMDQRNYFSGLDAPGPIYIPANAAEEGIQSGLGIKQLGQTLNPLQHQLTSLQARIRQGASKVEFEFMGKDKGSTQATTPETYGREEREAMRQLAELNKIQTSTHATFSVSGLAGFGQRGFDKRQQHETIKEVQRAIDFAKDATTGGAIVVHTGEWQRPVSEYYGEQGFKQYTGEDEEAQRLVVDTRTGQFIQGISKNKEVTIPKWHTAETWEKETGRKIVGTIQTDAEGHEHKEPIQADDYVDQNGNFINPTDVEQLFRRVPFYNKERVKFETETLDWEELSKRTKHWNERYAGEKKLTEEEYFAYMQIDNSILQAKGGSLFNLQRYEQDREAWEAIKDALQHYEQLDKDLPEDQKWRIMTQTNPAAHSAAGQYVPNQQISIPEFLRQNMNRLELSMRHTHESSAASDAQAADLEKQRAHIATVEEYGLKETGVGLARLGVEAMDRTVEAKKMRRPDERFDDLYIAPENWHPSMYGSHPDELLNIVQAGREQMARELMEQRHMSQAEAEEKAKKHIKTTFDIGHLNMWRSMMDRKKGESEEAFQNRFNTWIFDHLEKLHDAGALGHLHMTDNFGYNDEHLTLGQGNAPVKELVQWAKERGYDDFIIEQSGFNDATIMHDAWSYLGAVPWKAGPQRQAMTEMRHAHAGWYAPPNYIVGAYVPSNEWTLWTGVPLE